MSFVGSFDAVLTQSPQGRSSDSTAYLKIVVQFDSSATLQQVEDAWLTAPGQAPTSEELFITSLSGFFNANYDNVVIVLTQNKIRETSPGRFLVYQKTFFTGDFKAGRLEGEFDTSKDGQLNALKGIYNGAFQPPPVQFSNQIYHIHKSTGSVNET